MNTLGFSDIYKQYYKSSFLYVKSYIREDMVVEDIVSEALISLWEISKTEEIMHIQAYLVTLLKRKSLNYLKHQNVKSSAFEFISEKMNHDLNYRIRALEASFPEEIFSSEIITIVEQTLSSLSPQTRRIFEMSRVENLSVKEIAEQLSISPKSVEYHITKSLKALRIALKDYLLIFYLLFRF